MAEIITCSNCRRQLQIPESFFGQMVQCPECQHQFVATSTAVAAQPLPTTAIPPALPDPASEAAAAKRRRYEEDDVALAYDPLRRRSRYDVEEDDGEDEDDFQRPRRIRRYLKPHRSGLIMALGLVSLVGGLSFCAPAILGPIAWALGTYDLREMREGRMDPSGERLTRSGRICGIVATILMLLGGLLLLFIIMDG